MWGAHAPRVQHSAWVGMGSYLNSESFRQRASSAGKSTFDFMKQFSEFPTDTLAWLISVSLGLAPFFLGTNRETCNDREEV